MREPGSLKSRLSTEKVVYTQVRKSVLRVYFIICKMCTKPSAYWITVKVRNNELPGPSFKYWGENGKKGVKQIASKISNVA